MDVVDIINLSVLENTIGIICACLPSIHGLLKSFLPGVLGSLGSKKNTSFRAINDAETSSHKAASDLSTHHPTLKEHSASNPAILMTTVIRRDELPYKHRSRVPPDELRLVNDDQGAVQAQAWA